MKKPVPVPLKANDSAAAVSAALQVGTRSPYAGGEEY